MKKCVCSGSLEVPVQFVGEAAMWGSLVEVVVVSVQITEEEDW
jgi:hypothetical protein